ncbi:MAG: hypothetical protein RKE49_00750 [Oceanicaulis sp.]
MSEDGVSKDQIAAFIERWSGSGGGELSNTQSFLNELTDLLGVPRPDPSKEETALNDYVFERQVTRNHQDGTTSTRRIDLYKRGCFVLEAKQGADGAGRRTAGAAEVNLFGEEAGKGRAGTARRGTDRWYSAMQKARAQAEQYAKDLPTRHGWPPFLIVADIGYCFEIYADFSGQGKSYDQFPDRRGFRIQLEDLHKPEVRARLRAIWTDPYSLDPTRENARVTKEIAARLARVARELESRKTPSGARRHSAEQVALFLMRCLFTMFAEDVKLLPEGKFTALLDRMKSKPEHAHHALESLWTEMNEGAKFSGYLEAPIRRFNGGLFKDAAAIPLTAEMVSELHIAAKQDWKQVEPAIFGTLLEQALDKDERHRLGAHYTPRAYVDRLITPTLMEPLREDWAGVKAKVEGLMRQNKEKDALKALRDFHTNLCEVRVLDPACGTGNFLYVAMERMKRLEGEVVDAIVQLGGRARSEYKDHAIDPHQFLGIELNPRAAAIAELVLWIGYIQWQVKSGGIDFVYDPVLRDFHNIENRDAILDRGEAVLRRDAHGKPVTRWDGVSFKDHPVTGEKVPDESARTEIWDYPDSKPAQWPEAEFIVGNPPFIGNKRMIANLGEGYVETLRRAYPGLPGSIDLVMYWWAKAANILLGDITKRFGFVTTNSITMSFNRVVVEKALSGKKPISLVFAIGDHPWVKTSDSAAVRIAMTTAVAGDQNGRSYTVSSECDLASDNPEVTLVEQSGKLSGSLKSGANTASASPLKANSGLSFMGVIPVGLGFVVPPSFVSRAGYDLERLPAVLKKYLNGRELVAGSEPRLIIDFCGLKEREAADSHPKLFQKVLEDVRPFRMEVRREGHRKNWWLYGEQRFAMRKALAGVNRFIATPETSKHRWFTFLSNEVLPDQKIRVVALKYPAHLAALHSRIHIIWALSTGATLEDRPVYNTTKCFDPFPFPDLSDKPALKARLDDLGERLDAFRKERLAEHDFLTMTKLYNVLERVRALEAASAGFPPPPAGEVDGASAPDGGGIATDDAAPPSAPGSARDTSPASGGGKETPPLTETERDIYEAGLVGVLKDIHDQIDAAVFEAYGWPADLSEDAILERLVALNHERAEEEARGHVRWLRPEFQNPTGAETVKASQSEIVLPEAAKAAADMALPKDDAQRARAVRAVLAASPKPLEAEAVSAAFKGKGKKKGEQVEAMLAILEAVGQAERTADGRWFAGG